MSRHFHYFKPGKANPYLCAYRWSILNPDGEEEFISCREPKHSHVHADVNEDKTKWEYKYPPGKEPVVRY